MRPSRNYWSPPGSASAKRTLRAIDNRAVFEILDILQRILER